jgi:hypothetical protein
MMRAMFRDSFVAAALLAVVMTLGDMIWAALDLPHLRMYGVAHGAAMCLAFGAVVGWRARRIASGAIGGLVIGVLAALIFYALAWKLRAVALLPAWMSFWIMFAFLQDWLSGRRDPARAAIRGLIAAVLSGAVFVAISGIWTRPPTHPNYLVNLGAWAAAYFPGFFALFWRIRKDPRSYQ